MRSEDFDFNKIVETVQGTCTEDIQSALDYHYPGMTEEDLTEEDHNNIAMEVFVCDTCGWWCESSEEIDNGDNPERICSDHEDEEE